MWRNIFFLLLQTKEKWESASGVKKADRISNFSVFMGLLSLFRSTSTLGFSNSTLESVASDYRACKSNSTVKSLFPDSKTNSDILEKYSKKIHTTYELALKDMEAFIRDRLNLKPFGNHSNDQALRKIIEWLIKALLEVLANDASIKDDQIFFALENGSTINKRDLLRSNSYYLPSLLLGFWYYILTNCSDNENERATFEDWNEQKGETGTQWQFTSSIGNNYSRNITVYASLAEAQAARVEELNRAEEKKEADRRKAEIFLGPLPDVFSDFPLPQIAMTQKELLRSQTIEPLFTYDTLRDQYEWHDLHWQLPGITIV